MAATGRPPKYTRKLADAILHDISVNEHSLRTACATHNVAPGTFCGWVIDDVDGLSERYRRARQIRAHGLFDEMIEIADDAGEDFVETEKGPRFNREHVQRSSLRVSARQWALAKMLRDEFGEKVAVDHSGSIDVAGAAAGLAAKLGVSIPAGGAEGAADGSADDGASD